jgi:hypothetical protein
MYADTWLLIAHIHHGWETFVRLGRDRNAAKIASLTTCKRPYYDLALAQMFS